MMKITSTILGLTLVAAFSASEADASPPVLVHNGAPVSYSPVYGTPGHSARTYGPYGTRVRSPFSYGYNNMAHSPYNQSFNRPHGYGTTSYGTSGYGYPASRYNTPGHGGLNLGLPFGSY